MYLVFVHKIHTDELGLTHVFQHSRTNRYIQAYRLRAFVTRFIMKNDLCLANFVCFAKTINYIFVLCLRIISEDYLKQMKRKYITVL